MRGTATQQAAKQRQNLAQGEASPDDIGTSETLGNAYHASTARFSGRQNNLAPAKAGSYENAGHLPRAALRFTSFRFACPGLNSVAGYAGSLSAIAHRQIYFLVIVVLIVCFTGCQHDKGGGISSGAGGWPPTSSSSPAEVSSSAQVVRVIVPSATQIIWPGLVAEMVITLSISSGYHVNANPATFPYLIATEVTPGKADGITINKAIYPRGTKQTFQFAEQPLAVYEGETQIRLPIKADANAAIGARTLPVTVRVQACDNEKCFPPATLNVTIPIEVRAAVANFSSPSQ